MSVTPPRPIQRKRPRKQQRENPTTAPASQTPGSNSANRAIGIERDLEGDQLYVSVAEGHYLATRRLDAKRLIDVATDGTILGVDFASASQGVDLTGLPHAEAITRTLHSHGIKVLTPHTYIPRDDPHPAR